MNLADSKLFHRYIDVKGEVGQKSMVIIMYQTVLSVLFLPFEYPRDHTFNDVFNIGVI